MEQSKKDTIENENINIKEDNARNEKNTKEKIAIGFLVLVSIFAVLILFFTAKSIFLPTQLSNQQIQQSSTQMPSTSRMSLTLYDKELAKQMMDKNNDGKCDACGMPVEMCMDSGQLQCNMDSESTIGVLGSQHIHTDWKIYFNGKPYDFSSIGDRHERQMKGDPEIKDTSAFMHIHPAQLPEKVGDIVHMHATGVPLWIFFESIEMKLPNEIKVYVNGKEISDYKNYVFNDLDKILITDGKGDLQEQLNSITDFAKIH